ncbi:MAG: hypothetical protein ACR2L2_02430 [Acidobacteriota bacterium]
MTQAQVQTQMESLFGIYDADAFVKELKKTLPQLTDATALARDAALYLAPRTVHNDYERFIPYALCGISAALEASSFAKEEDKVKPVLQQMGLAHIEDRNSPVDIEAIPADRAGRINERVEKLSAALRTRDFERSFALLAGLVEDPEDALAAREATMLAASRDLLHGGHKLYFLARMWQMAERMQREKAAVYLYPALHYLLKAPVDSALADSVEQLTAGEKSSFPVFNNSKKSLGEAELERLHSSLLFEDRTTAVGAVIGQMRDGFSVESVLEGVQLAAAQALINAQRGRWLLPVRAFFYTDCVRTINSFLASEQRFLLAALAGAAVNQASTASREEFGKDAKKNRPWPERVEKVWPADPFTILRSGQNNSDVGAVISSVLAILEMGEERQAAFFETLVRLTAKNDAAVCLGYDIALCGQSIANFQANKGPSRNLHILALAFFIATSEKRFNFFGGLGF